MASTGDMSVMTPRMKTNKEPFDMASFRESLALAEIQARSAARKEDNQTNITTRRVRKRSQSTSSADQNYVPPKQLLMYLVRMGSFTSMPKVAAVESQDDDLEFFSSTAEHLIRRCRTELDQLPPPLTRQIVKNGSQSDIETDITSNVIRVLQWNHLSQTLGTKNDKFVRCPSAALDWRTRRWRLLEEILMYDPDIVCLQEVDHFSFLHKSLGCVGYVGRFVAKPDSPCIYLPDNSGPDGCAILYKSEKFELVSSEERFLEVWKVQSNQVVMLLNLRFKDGSGDFCVATTHLKARTGALLSTLRNEQGKDILEWLNSRRNSRPLILTGDMNAEPSEPVYGTMTTDKDTPLVSAYGEPAYTTWKIREDGEHKQTLDYMFHTPDLEVVATLDLPTEEQIGRDRLPNMQYPSDHLSLLADFTHITWQ